LKRGEILEARRVASKKFLANSGEIKELSVNRYSTVTQLRDPTIHDAVDEDEGPEIHGAAGEDEAALYIKVISATENSMGLRPVAGTSRRVCNSKGNAVALVVAMGFSKFSVKMSLLLTGPLNTWPLSKMSGQGKRWLTQLTCWCCSSLRASEQQEQR
jgi:hypothetical protein